MKKYVRYAVIVFCLAFVAGVWMYRSSQTEENATYIAEAAIEDECTEIAETTSTDTSTGEDKITPNTVLVKKIYYNDCKHLIQTAEKITEELVNKSKSELQIEYIDWEIQKFTTAEVVLYKELYDFCNEHYMLKDIDGYIGIYQLDKYGKIVELKSKTEIATKYLTDVDYENLQKGLKIYTRTELNKAIEDFE